MATHSIRTTKLDLRLSPQAKRTLAAAAEASNRSVSQFVLDSALAAAAETLPDRRRFDLDDERWAAFQAALDAPARGDLQRLQRLFVEPSPFEASPPE